MIATIRQNVDLRYQTFDVGASHIAATKVTEWPHHITESYVPRVRFLGLSIYIVFSTLTSILT
jgi:hypothetical protein